MSVRALGVRRSQAYVGPTRSSCFTGRWGLHSLARGPVRTPHRGARRQLLLVVRSGSSLRDGDAVPNDMADEWYTVHTTGTSPADQEAAMARVQSLARTSPRWLQKELMESEVHFASLSQSPRARSTPASLSSNQPTRTVQTVAPAPPPRSPVSDLQRGALYGAAVSLVVGALLYCLPTSSDRDKPKRAITRSGNNSSKRAARMLADDSITNLREGWAEKVARLEADMDNTTSQLENLRLKQQRLQQTQQSREAEAIKCAREADEHWQGQVCDELETLGNRLQALTELGLSLEDNLLGERTHVQQQLAALVDDRERFTQEMDSLDTRLGQTSNAMERVMQLPRSQWEPTVQGLGALMAKSEALREMLLTMCVQVEQSEAAAMRMLATVDAQLRTVDATTTTQTALELELATFRSKWASEPDILLLEPIMASSAAAEAAITELETGQSGTTAPTMGTYQMGEATQEMKDMLEDLELDFSIGLTSAQKVLDAALDRTEAAAAEEAAAVKEAAAQEQADALARAEAAADEEWDALAEEEASATATGPVLQLVMAAAVIPHPDKAHYGGEDAHFVTTDGAGALGVCDGVGGWASDGLSSRDYALELLARCQERLPPSAKADEVGEGLRSSMFHAHSQVTLPGSTTVCLLQLDDTGALHACNLGDSGFRVVRKGQMVFASSVQEVTFNMPYQLGAPRHMPETNTARDAALYELRVQAGDVVVLGTDGLFDNLSDGEVVELTEVLSLGVDAVSLDAVQATADGIATQARAMAQSKTAVTPWSRELGVELERRGQLARVGVSTKEEVTGGKLDDITVVVACVQPCGA